MKETLNILIVEDNPGDSLLIEEYLSECSLFKYNIAHAENLRTALLKLKTEQFDVTVLDLNLPDSNGLDTVKKVLKEAPTVAVVVMTGLDDNETGQEALELGAQEYVVKNQVSCELFNKSICHSLVRKADQNQLVFLNRVLTAIRKVNYLITHENDKKKIVNTATEILVDSKAFLSAWIALFDEKGKLGITSSSGENEGIDRFFTDLNKGISHPCIKEVLKTEQEVTLIHQMDEMCIDCPMYQDHKDDVVLLTRIEHQATFYGILSVRINRQYRDNKDILNLFKDLANDISFSFYSLHVQEQEKKLTKQLENSLSEIKKINLELNMKDRKLSNLLNASKSVIKYDFFEKTAREIFDICKNATGAESGYVALLSKDGKNNDVLFLDPGGKDCTVDENLPMPIRGLRAEAYQKLKAVYHNDFMRSPHVKYMPEGHVILDNIIFAPLVINDEPVGLIGLANKDGGFNDEDADILNSLAELCSVALHNSRINMMMIQEKEHAEKSDRLKSIFLANMSHEIRTPLNGILGFSKLLCQKNLSSEKKNEFIGIIKKSNDQLLRIINDIIDISKIEIDQLTIFPAPCDLESVVNDIENVYTVNELIMKKKLSFTTILPPQCRGMTVQTDEERLKQIMINLLNNAIKYTNEGKIELGIDEKSVATGSDKIVFYVKDTGKGIPEKDQDIIFERFRQVEEQQYHEGFGLGLSISRGLVDLLGGDMWFESKEGIGSTFYFSIPLLRSSDKVKDKKTDDQSELDLSGYHIMIAEDDMISFQYIKEILDRYHVTLSHALNGAECLEMMKNTLPDLLLLDLQMPIMSGYDLLEEMKKQNIRTKVIAQTAFAMNYEKDLCIKKGCVDYLTKPISEEALLSSIREVLKI